MKFENIKFDDFRFIDESSWYLRFDFWLKNWIIRLTRTTSIVPPVVYKGSKGYRKWVHIDDLSKALGISDPQAITLIGLHKRRLRQRIIRFLAVYLPLTLPVGFMPLLTVWSSERILGSGSVGPLSAFAFLGISFAFIFVYIPAIMKISAMIVDKHYADSLCVLIALFALCEMTRDDVLLNPTRRRSLLHRIDSLARLTRLLGVNFPGGSESTRGWSLQHFQNLELYVRENERAVIAPTEKTIVNLREKMASLIELYLFGRYGDDVWNGKKPDHDQIQESDVHRRKSRFQRIIGPIIPGALLIVIGIYPDIVNSIGIEKNTIFLIILTWLVLALDLSLGLGVIDKVVKTAKEIKELK